MVDAEGLESYAAALSRAAVNVTESYADWLQVVFACASFGERGRTAAHLLSSVSTKYKEEETDRQFDACLRSVRERNNAAPILALASASGVRLVDVLRGNKAQRCEARTDGGQPSANFPDLGPFPMLAELAAIAPAPSLLPSLVWAFCAGFSAVVPSLRILYGGSMQHCHLYYCLAAPAASGKSSLSIVAKCFGKWHARQRARSEAEWADYEERLKAADAADRGLIKEPPQRSLFLPADTTTAALLASVRDNDGGGLIWESELDTLVRAFRSEFGSYSDILRNNYHSEPIRSNRKQGRQFIELDDSHFSAVVCGTPRQVGDFFKSPENGLYSRFAFGSLPPSLEWRSQWEAPNFAPVVASVGECVAAWGDAMQGQPVEVTFTPSQRAEHTRRWAALQELIYGMAGDEILPSVRRLGLMQVRLAAVLALMAGGVPQSAAVECPAVAWQLAAFLAESAASDAVALLSLLPASEQQGGKKAAERENVLLSLPPEFDVSQLPPSLSTATRYRWLAVWEREGKITKCDNKWHKR